MYLIMQMVPEESLTYMAEMCGTQPCPAARDLVSVHI